jgi:hypothetical protein
VLGSFRFIGMGKGTALPDIYHSHILKEESSRGETSLKSRADQA